MIFYLLCISIFVLLNISTTWCMENQSTIEHSLEHLRPRITQSTFYPPFHLDKEYQLIRPKKKIRQRPYLNPNTFFIPPTLSEQRFLAQWSRITTGCTLQKRFEFVVQESKSVNNLLKGDNPLLSKIFSDVTCLSQYFLHTIITSTDSYVTFIPTIDSDIKKIINDKTQEHYSLSYPIDSPNISSVSVPEDEILQFSYKGGIASFHLGQYLTICVEGPKMHPQNKSIIPLTLNGFGCNVFESNYLINLFYNHCQPGMHILDIGSGAGVNAFAALKKGATVIAVDLSAENLELLWGSTIPEYRQNLWLTVNSFPEETTFYGNSLDSALMSFMAHYLTGSKLRLGIKKVHKWLKPGGCFFFQSLTPYSNPYIWNVFHTDLVARYGQEWPGYFRDEKKELMHRHNLKTAPNIPGCMPNFGHPIHPYIIERELKRVGFEIIYINYGSFSPLLSQKYPVTYKEIEDYVKDRMSTTDQLFFESHLCAAYPELLSQLQLDKIKYQKLIEDKLNNSSFHNGWTWENMSQSYRGTALQTMEIVVAMAIKKK